MAAYREVERRPRLSELRRGIREWRYCSSRSPDRRSSGGQRVVSQRAAVPGGV